MRVKPLHQLALLTLMCASAGCASGTVSKAPDASAIRTPPGEPAPGEIELRQLRPDVWIHTSYYTYPGGARVPANGLVVREGDGLLLVDTAWGERLTRALLERIETELGLPVRRAVVTHSHYDRVAGVDVLEARRISVYAHSLTQRRAIGQGMPVPDTTLPNLDAPGASIRLGAIEIFFPGPGHAPDNLMVWVPSQRVLFGGCAVRAAASLTLGSVSDADLASWPEAIGRAQARYPEAEIVVPGHGDPGGADLLEHTMSLLKRPEPEGAQ